MFTVYGHRGLPSKAPENTLASYKAASKVSGLKWVEFDVAITKDEQLVIIHDDYLDRTTDMVGEVTQLNYNELQNASAGSWFGPNFKEEKLPTFDDVIKFANSAQVNLNVELKGVTGDQGTKLSESMVTQVAEKLKVLDAHLEVMISSFNIPLVKLSERIMPKYKRAVLFKAAAFESDWRTVLEFCGSKTVNIEDAKLTQARVKMIKNAGYELNVWTVNKKLRANQLANWGVDGIFTDKADDMVHLEKS
ncbi:glycerophosphoryl diester phosphodiesterase [Staphylococcus succinus]|uniref:glycerophosphoryl diester phosphodiesterase n=1 Tax=Staphylococcus succinus TaxID=61015 RepID=UPI000937F44E|nr:glycerophosphoryl diester phosphodiesterase [Staphylococcus succinus]MEB8210309.1 glycerophosphoryl diester phosphodiesterase [Staphylococcus succinus]PTJ19342.1 glycerophosphoryl diester phosphodiesterase [Staphylococcus succinus]RIN29254.1 glycerophosphoryl diester phosphodiesterase [Staphylococcus succinus]RIN31714.1 glycerophosphoryl diester phosphodiesterase [Staphylococcus succinus]RIN37216.1 glycerophosphoryl diester phosphodiesterase [Staphylococcus succinus]